MIGYGAPCQNGACLIRCGGISISSAPRPNSGLWASSCVLVSLMLMVFLVSLDSNVLVSVGHNCFAVRVEVVSCWICLCSRQRQTKSWLEWILSVRRRYCASKKHLQGMLVWEPPQLVQRHHGSVPAKSMPGCSTADVIPCLKACLFSAPCTAAVTESTNYSFSRI